MEKPSLQSVEQVLAYLSNLSLTADQQWTADISSYKFPHSILPPHLLINIISYSSDLFRKEPNILEIKAPVFIVGDLHGQFFDFRTLVSLSNSTKDIPKSNSLFKSVDTSMLKAATFPAKLDLSPAHSYLFLGDYVDRGSFSCEIVIALLCLKILYPTQIHLIRGNHETRTMTSHKFDDNFNLKTEIEEKFQEGGDVDLYQSFMSLFDCLPLGALVFTKEGKWFSAHGGIGKKLTSLDQLRELDRIGEPPLNGAFCDVMWSDPLLEDLLVEINIKTEADYQEFLELDYLPNVVRGCSSLYGHASIHEFLRSNELHGIIRAHQCKEQGFVGHYQETRYHPYYYPMVLTVFSAPNYVGTHGNLGAFLHLKSNSSSIEVIQFNTEQAVCLEISPNPEGKRFSYPPNVKDTSINTLKIERDTGVTPAPDTTNVSSITAQASISQTDRSRFMTAPAISKLKRKSLTLLRQGTLGEQGSEKFRQAMNTSIECEKHPGWNSFRRATLTIGQFQAALRLSKVNKNISYSTSGEYATPSNTVANDDDDAFKPIGVPDKSQSADKKPQFPRSKSDNTPVIFSKARSSQMSQEDNEQIRILFDSIDKNGDGKITNKEFSNFLFNIEEYNFNQGIELFKEIDRNSDGFVDFEEFCSYICNIDLIPEESIVEHVS